MFSIPDTTTIKVGNAEVLVAIYSPHKLVTSKYLAEHLEQLLLAARDYLGGKLPVDKYAFIYYLMENKRRILSGVLGNIPILPFMHSTKSLKKRQSGIGLTFLPTNSSILLLRLP
jgi:hypothetical protein